MCVFTFCANFLEPVTFLSAHFHLVAKPPPRCNLFVHTFILEKILRKDHVLLFILPNVKIS